MNDFLQTKYIINFFDSENKKIDELDFIRDKKEAKKIAEEFLKINNYTTYKIKKEKTLIHS